MLEKPSLNKFLFLIAVIFNLLAAAYTFAAADNVTFERDELQITTKNGTQKFNTEIAQSNAQLEKGLMYREKIAEDESMLFLFPKDMKIAMWMKNTLIPLDMLFIDKSGKIIYIAHDTKPNSLDVISAGATPVRAVLEIGGGIAQKKNIVVGDSVNYKAFEK